MPRVARSGSADPCRRSRTPRPRWTTSSSASTAGSATSSRRTTPPPWKTAARITPPPGPVLAPRTPVGRAEDERGDGEDEQRGDEHDRGHRVDLGRHPELDLRVDVRSQSRLVADGEPGDDELVDREGHADQRAGQDGRRDERQDDVRMACRGDAPRSAAAHSSARSKPCNREATMSTTNGTVTTSWPAMTVPARAGDRRPGRSRSRAKRRSGPRGP